MADLDQRASNLTHNFWAVGRSAGSSEFNRSALVQKQTNKMGNGSASLNTFFCLPEIY